MPMPKSPASPEDDQAYYRGILHGLIDIGANLAQRLHRQAEADEAGSQPQGTPDLETITTAFDRTARAVRRTIALANHLANAGAARPANQTATTRTAARRRIIRDVEDAILRHQRIAATINPAARERAQDLYAELNERLEDPELEADLQTRPIPEIIEEICRDLGVASHNRPQIWKRRRPKDLAALKAQAETPTPTPHLHLVPPTTRKRE